jgi:ABC-type sugar transport system substrate-binding protein
MDLEKWTDDMDEELTRRLNPPVAPSRRGFLQGVGATIAGAAGIGWLEACTTTNTTAGTQEAGQVSKALAIDPTTWPKGKTIAYISTTASGETPSRSIGAAKAVTAKAGWKLELFDANGDNTKAAQAIQSYANQGIDAICLGIIAPAAVTAGVAAAKAAKIPMGGVFAGYTPDINFDVTSNEWISASRVGTYALQRMGGVGSGGKGSVIMLASNGIPLDPIVIRQKTFHAMVDFTKGVQVVAEPATDFSNGFTSAKAQVLALLQKFPKGQLDLIWVSFGQLASVASQAVTEAGRQNDVFVVGDDGNLAEFDQIRSGGPEKATIVNDLEGVTAVCFDAFAKIFQGQKVSPVLYVDAPFITKANVPPPNTYPKGAGLQEYYTGSN